MAGDATSFGVGCTWKWGGGDGDCLLVYLVFLFRVH